MYDQDSYALYCTMILQQNQEIGLPPEPGLLRICEYYNAETHSPRHQKSQEVHYEQA